MKKLFSLFSFFILPISVHAMTAHLHDKMTPEMFVGMKSEAGQWLHSAQNKLKNMSTRFKTATFNAQYSAVQKGLEWLDESEVKDKDKWVSKAFGFINKKKPELLGAMLNHYERIAAFCNARPDEKASANNRFSSAIF